LLYRIVYFAGKEALGSKPFSGEESAAVEHAKTELKSQKGATKAVVRDRNLKVVTEVNA
jgi:hypothetical protein